MEETRPSSNFLLLAACLAVTLFVFPSLLNPTSQIFPSLLLALVLFAITYGFLSGSNHVGDSTWLGSYGSSDMQKSSLSNPIALSECSDSYGHGRCPDQRAQVIAYDRCDLNAAVKEMEAPVPAQPRKRAAPKERKAKRTCQTNALKSKDDIKNSPAAAQVPQRPSPPSCHSLEEKSKKNRGGLENKNSSSSTKKKNRRQERIESSKSPPVPQSLPSSSHQPLPGTPIARTKGKKMADLAASPPPAAPHKKKSHTPVTATPNSEPSDDNPNRSGLSPSTSLQQPPPQKGPWVFAMSGGYVLINDPLPHISPDAEDYDDSVWEKIGNASYDSSKATSPAVPLCQDVEFDNLISMRRAQLKLEAMNSRKRRRSNLGPEVME